MKDIDIIFHLGCLRRITRSWAILGYQEAQSVAEHSYRVAMISYFLACKYRGEVNAERILLMALIHDIPEVLCGDLNNLQRDFAYRSEDKAMYTIFGKTDHYEILDVWRQYRSDKPSLEADIVHDADSLEAIIEMIEENHKAPELFEVFLRSKNDKLDKLRLEESRVLAKELLEGKYKHTDWIVNYINA